MPSVIVGGKIGALPHRRPLRLGPPWISLHLCTCSDLITLSVPQICYLCLTWCLSVPPAWQRDRTISAAGARFRGSTETLHAKGWQRGTAVNVYCRLFIEFFKFLPSRIYLSLLVCFFSNSQKIAATKMCYIIPPLVLYNSSLKRSSEAGRVTDFYMRVLSPVLPSDFTQRSSCLMTENQINVVLKKRCIVPLAFPLSLNRKSVISDDFKR